MRRTKVPNLLPFSLAVAALVFTPPQHGNGQVTTPGLGATNTIVTTYGSSAISYSPATADSGGNIFNVNMLTANTVVTAPASPPTGATTQGLATILVATYMNSTTYPATGTLACWTSTGYAQTCPSSASSGIIGITASAPTAIGTTNYVQIARMGTATCQFTPTSATQGDYVIASSTSGQCTDAGMTYPSSNQVVGTVVSTGAAGVYYVFTMNDQQSLPAVLAGANTWTGGNTWSGADSFLGATSLLMPNVAYTAFDDTLGSLAFDTTNNRYLLGGGTATNPVKMVVSTVPLGVTNIPSGDTICWEGGPCDNSGSNTLSYFNTAVPLPTGFFSAAGRTVRLTFNVSVSSSSVTGRPTSSFTLAYSSTTTATPVPLYTSSPVTLTASTTHQYVQIVCTVTGTATASSSATLIPGCTSGNVIAAPPFSLLSYDTLGAVSSIPTNDTSEELLLGVAYSGTGTAGTTDHTTLISVTPEFIQ